MGMIIDVPEELSNRVVANLLTIIEAEKDGKKKEIRKICSQCITYLSLRDINYDKAETNIQLLKSELSDDNSFYLILLAVLYESLDEDETAIEYFNKVAEYLPADSFRDELLEFIELGKFKTLSDYSQLEKAGLILIDKYSNDSEISHLLWQLSTEVNPSEHIPAFEKLSARAMELYPDNYGVEHFRGFIYDISSNFEDALKSFLSVKDGIEKDVDNPGYNLQLTNIWYYIASCYLKMVDPEKTIESCDIALQYNEKSEEYSIEPVILNKKAEALLLKGEKEPALSIIMRILEQNPEDEKAKQILEKIKTP